MSGQASKFDDLHIRLISALALGLIALVVFVFGGLWSAALLALGCGAMIWEWREMVVGKGQGLRLRALPMVIAGPVGVLVADQWDPFTGIFAMLVLLAIGAGAERARLRFILPGVAYIGIAMICIEALRNDTRFGFLAVLWLVLIVIAADVGGYFGGRIFGGPKLWPRVSPKKTWAGVIGGVLFAQITGFVFGLFTAVTYAPEVALMSAVVALVSVGGDLIESSAKRYFGVKDSSRLMPGHGGILDRLDGLMAAAIFVAAISFFRGQSIFLW
ncbi:phosphatidate cytidylyltransferase [Pontivivens insulae]|uniref:Phosphatidate cytidylyltransferase n=1 Tax=Pontivivens insulae TaxID=1639689 RepID=A0A2R8AAP3_9RHOB|nr:phosphatidate cytidylyltransferase [Pontivivens insulae]RED13210.1 phosphatidate cytidylyltransferase [Pontivivens insulae]SPF29302.1 Phosphatidate cytidylyltransferase [Pontivivens insulae]